MYKLLLEIPAKYFHNQDLANMMVSNSHLPLSTLLMMVSAFAGYHLLMDCYQTAIKEKYHFGTYGDAMLIL